MLPRKRPRPNPGEASSKAPSTTSLTPATSTSQAPSASEQSASGEGQMPPRPANGKDTSLGGQNTQKEVRKTKSWYGSWPRTPKASASTSVAKENILGGTVKTNKTPDLSRFESRKNSDSASLYSTTETVACLSKIPEDNPPEFTTPKNKPTEPMIAKNKSSDTITQQGAGKNEGHKVDSEAATSKPPDTSERPKTPELPTQDETTKPGTPAKAMTTPQPQTTSSTWLGWWSRTPFTEDHVTLATDADMTMKDSGKEAEESRPVTPPAQTESEETPLVPQSAPPSSTSWLGFWYGSNDTAAKPDESQDPPRESASNNTSQDTDATMTDAPPPLPPHKHEPAPKAGSTWAFWAKDSPKSKGAVPEPESGEIAVIGEGSEAHPKPMTEQDVSPTKERKDPLKKEAPTGARSWRKKNKRLRPQSMDIDSQSKTSSGASTPTGSVPQAQDLSQPVEQVAKVGPSNKSTTESEVPAKPSANLLLPSFSSTYHMKENPSILKQVAQFLLRTEQSPANHVFRLKDPPKIHKAIAIGVHGLFPATYLRPMIGQPTGTSLRFANLCADAIRKWADAHGCGDCEIEKVALEGEGKINERVDNLWKLMLNWIDHIRSADLVLIACHSQGVPVSIMLLEKLIDLGIITNAKIGVCAMAGVSLGPFPEYKSGLLMGSAAELWDFGNPESNNTKRFEAALKRVTEHGARITLIGSIDDQLVPLESAVYAPANHPYIYRAVFIDGRVHAPDFIAHLVGFALKLRNLGISDHGLIRELSIPLAGSLYSGEGHSRLYYDSAIYDLAVSHALETTTTAPCAPCEISKREAPGAPNPYVLPWIMRGLLEEDFVKTALTGETEELLKQFDDWKPANKALKDVKYRLEAVRSKL
ncbi:Fc.00g007210.m01.CDS01 [Cosmosporella sp. VM-42]